jgi:hypothetical protein
MCAVGNRFSRFATTTLTVWTAAEREIISRSYTGRVAPLIYLWSRQREFSAILDSKFPVAFILREN